MRPASLFVICLYFISCARKSKRPGFVRLVCFGEKKSAKTTNDFPEGIWYNTSILAGVYQSTLMVRCGNNKEDIFIRETPGAALWRHVAMRPPSPAVVRMRIAEAAQSESETLWQK